MSNERLVTNLQYPRKMEQFVQRIKAGLKAYDPLNPQMKELMEENRRQMKETLLKKKISERKAEKVIDEAITIALDYRLEPLRRHRCLSAREAEQKELKQLIRAIDTLKQAVSKLEAGSRKELNKTTAKQDWHHFDTEAFAAILHAMMETLPTLSPACIADDAVAAINERTLPGSNARHVRKIVRTAGPAILELWETIPAITRIQTEKFLRRLPPGTSVVEFLRRFGDGLAKFKSGLKDGRRPAMIRVFARRVAKLWRGLGLHVGRAFDGYAREERDSIFQQFCRFALAAVGDRSGVSRRQVCNVQGVL